MASPRRMGSLYLGLSNTVRTLYTLRRGVYFVYKGWFNSSSVAEFG